MKALFLAQNHKLPFKFHSLVIFALLALMLMVHSSGFAQTTLETNFQNPVQLEEIAFAQKLVNPINQVALMQSPASASSDSERKPDLATYEKWVQSLLEVVKDQQEKLQDQSFDLDAAFTEMESIKALLEHTELDLVSID